VYPVAGPALYVFIDWSAVVPEATRTVIAPPE